MAYVMPNRCISLSFSTICSGVLTSGSFPSCRSRSPSSVVSRNGRNRARIRCSRSWALGGCLVDDDVEVGGPHDRVEVGADVAGVPGQDLRLARELLRCVGEVRVLRVPVGTPLVLVLATADAHLDATARDDVDRRGHFRQVRGLGSSCTCTSGPTAPARSRRMRFGLANLPSHAPARTAWSKGGGRAAARAARSSCAGTARARETQVPAPPRCAAHAAGIRPRCSGCRRR
jgi:hypothetical protein